MGGPFILMSTIPVTPGDNLLYRQFVVNRTETGGLKAQNHKQNHFNSKIILPILDVNNMHHI